MAKIEIADLPSDMRVSTNEMRNVMGGRLGGSSLYPSRLLAPTSGYVLGPSVRYQTPTSAPTGPPTDPDIG